MCQRYEPRAAHGKLGALERLLRWPVALPETDEEYLQQTREWEADVRRYEELTGTTLDKDMKIALVVARAPADLQKHLRMAYASYAGNVEMLKTLILSYVQAGRSWQQAESSVATAQAMEVDYIRARGRGSERGRGGRGSKMEVDQEARRPTPHVYCSHCGK